MANGRIIFFRISYTHCFKVDHLTNTLNFAEGVDVVLDVANAFDEVEFEAVVANFYIYMACSHHYFICIDFNTNFTH